MSLSKTDRSKKEEHKVSQMSPKRSETTTEPTFKEFFLEFLKSEKLRRNEESRLLR